ncbi:hypothetical protein [Streptomyces sp. NPDC060194]|uniref:hypothetical protein n=1 Tax=Streptomyces sp. NPDC060194 TaxID=3347069 RepID=UPI00365F1FBA
MKITKRLGESPPIRAIRPVLATRGAGRALTTGSSILARRGWARLGEHLSPLERIGAVAGGGYVLGHVALNAPEVTQFAAPGAALAWCAAALAVAPPAEQPEQPDEHPTATPAPAAEDVFAATLDWVRDQIGDRTGVHLADLLAHAHAHGLHTDLDVPALRAALGRWGIPVRQQLKVGGRNRPGIHRDDLPSPPSPDPAPEAATSAAYPP